MTLGSLPLFIHLLQHSSHSPVRSVRLQEELPGVVRASQYWLAAHYALPCSTTFSCEVCRWNCHSRIALFEFHVVTTILSSFFHCVLLNCFMATTLDSFGFIMQLPTMCSRFMHYLMPTCHFDGFIVMLACFYLFNTFSTWIRWFTHLA